MDPTPVFLPGKFNGHRSLVGRGTWRATVHEATKDSATTERAHAHTHTHTHNHPHDLITSQRSHFQIHWALGFNMNFGRIH